MNVAMSEGEEGTTNSDDDDGDADGVHRWRDRGVEWVGVGRSEQHTRTGKGSTVARES